MSVRVGAQVVKVKGQGFGGKPCSRCGHVEYARLVAVYGEDEAERWVVQHPETWQHIFSPSQIKPIRQLSKAELATIRERWVNKT